MDDDQRKLEIEEQRGQLSQQVLDNPIYQEALVIMKGDLMLQFENTKFEDAEKRNEVWRQMQTLSRFEMSMEKIMKTGKIAKHNLSLKEKAKALVGL